MHLVRFRFQGRVGHFLRAEMNASALSYPIPPRTVLLGLLGNILGLAKDEAPSILGDAAIAVGGNVPRRHYHRANVRKAFPAALPTRIKPVKSPDSQDEGTGSGYVSQVVQEWLLDPDFVIYAGSPGPADWFSDLDRRLREMKSHFTPCLGLAWMIAQVRWETSGQAQPLSEGIYDIHTVCPRSEGNQLALPRLLERKDHAVQEVRMPRTVSSQRVFTHANYYLEMQGRPIPVRTNQAWTFEQEAIVFL